MTHQVLEIRATGTKNADSEGHEVYLLGYLSRGAARLLQAGDFAAEGWELVEDIACGPGLGRVQYGARGTGGRVALPSGDRARLALLTHPWSGEVHLQLGDSSLDLDLYSAETGAIIVDMPSGEVQPAEPDAFRRLALDFYRTAVPPTQMQAPDGPPPPEGEIRIRATGRAAPGALSSEVVVLQVEPLGFGVPGDLSAHARTGADWLAVDEAQVKGRLWKGGIKSTEGTLTLACEPEARIILLRHEWSGIAEIAYGDTTVLVDLYAPEPGLLELRPRDLARLRDRVGAEGAAVPVLAGTAGRTERRALYERLCAGFDSSRPIALHVPRWHGVAASTRALFDQVLPVPEGPQDHPDDITEADIVEYAEILVATGCRHFVISGGDLFNLKIVEKVQQMAPETRFDQLWHSNFLQMGEPHDWNLLRHWLNALEEGTITRIGVVKEGLERWFARLGLDAVFIPNVVPFEPAEVRPTTVQDTVGIWLSGSSSYRKLPHAALLALRMVPEVALMGSGLDPYSLQMINDLQLPFRQVSPQPLPHAQLMRRMRQTGLTLYVTMSECSPMVPLESFALGVPCLVGPSSHLFRRSPVLSEALVVQHPQSPGEIAAKMRAALQDQAGLFDAYLEYYEEEKQMADDGIARLIA